jgi:hypothetical protein
VPGGEMDGSIRYVLLTLSIGSPGTHKYENDYRLIYARRPISVMNYYSRHLKRGREIHHDSVFDLRTYRLVIQAYDMNVRSKCLRVSKQLVSKKWAVPFDWSQRRVLDCRIPWNQSILSYQLRII